MLQTSLLLMKSLNKTETPIFLSVVCSLFPKTIFLTFIVLRSGLWTWLAKLAYQVMLTIRGRLITPFILGSMSVDLNIQIRHSFTDL